MCWELLFKREIKVVLCDDNWMNPVSPEGSSGNRNGRVLWVPGLFLCLIFILEDLHEIFDSFACMKSV